MAETYNQIVARTQGPGMALTYTNEAPNTGPYAPNSGDPTRDPWLQDTTAHQWGGPGAQQMNALERQKARNYDEKLRIINNARGQDTTAALAANASAGATLDQQLKDYQGKQQQLQNGGGGYDGGGMAGAYTGAAGSSASGGGGYVGGYELPGASAAAQSMRDLQTGAMSGLQGLLSRDSAAERKKMEDAIYASSERGINTAADRARQTMLEGTFARGVGSSSILTELAGRGQQEHSDALAQAAREAYIQAGDQDRAELASLLGLNQGAFNSATAGLQGEANVALTNLARMQQESQFGRNLAFQGSENAANRAQSASQFGQGLGLQQQQLAQQNSQFGQSLGLQQNQLAQQGSQFDANLGLNYAQLGQNASQFDASQAFTGTQNQLNRDANVAAQQAQAQQAMALLNQQQAFSGTQNDATRELQRYLATQQQTFAGDQNQLNRNTDLEHLLLTLDAQDQRSRDALVAGGLGAGIGGAGTLLGSLLNQWGRA